MTVCQSDILLNICTLVFEEASHINSACWLILMAGDIYKYGITVTLEEIYNPNMCRLFM